RGLLFLCVGCCFFAWVAVSLRGLLFLCVGCCFFAREWGFFAWGCVSPRTQRNQAPGLTPAPPANETHPKGFRQSKATSRRGASVDLARLFGAVPNLPHVCKPFLSRRPMPARRETVAGQVLALRAYFGRGKITLSRRALRLLGLAGVFPGSGGHSTPP